MPRHNFVGRAGAWSAGVEIETKVVEAEPQDVSDHRARPRRSIGRSELDVGPDLGARVEVRVGTGPQDGSDGEVGAKPEVGSGSDHQECAVVGQPFLVDPFEDEVASS